MDIRCPKCGEPWDLDSLHDEVADRKACADAGDPDPVDITFDSVRKDFYRRGCAALTSFGGHCNPEVNGKAATLASAAYDILGDDLDGAACMLEDAEAAGLFD